MLISPTAQTTGGREREREGGWVVGRRTLEFFRIFTNRGNQRMVGGDQAEAARAHLVHALVRQVLCGVALRKRSSAGA